MNRYEEILFNADAWKKGMEEEYLINIPVGRSKNLIDYKYNITPKELIFQDEKTTIINWTDGTKTVVKCSDNDTFSPEAGVALCYMKKFITDNDSERFHKLLKSLIIDISKVRYSKEVKESNNNSECLRGLLKDLASVYKFNNSKEDEDDNKI